jgi:hypothetical protein
MLKRFHVTSLRVEKLGAILALLNRVCKKAVAPVVEGRITDIQECGHFRSDYAITTSFLTLHIPSFLGHFAFRRNVQ